MGTGLREVFRYWRQCLADADLMKVDDHDGAKPVDPRQLRSGHLPTDVAEALFKAAKALRRDGGKESDLPVPIVIECKALSPHHDHAVAVPGTQSIFYPMAVPALLSRDGQLMRHRELLPWIGRQHLEPTIDTGRDAVPIVGELSAYDEFLSTEPLAESASWSDVVAWAERLWSQATAIDGQFTLVEHLGRISLLDATKGAGRSIVALYDNIEADRPELPLAENLVAGSTAPQVLDDAVRRRGAGAARGHVSDRMGLNRSQADAVAAFTQLRAGEILAVNGPPGTGKTTLLQDIIATECVERAIAGGEPAVIVVSSTNNQAVTNVSRSLAKALEENRSSAGKRPWAVRWIAGVRGLGTYIPSARKEKEIDPKEIVFIAGSGANWKGAHADAETDPDFVEKAASAWSARFLDTFGRQPASLEEGVESLRADVQRVAADGAMLAGQVDALRRIEDEWALLCRGQDPVEWLAGRREHLQALVSAVARDAAAADAAAAAAAAREAEVRHACLEFEAATGRAVELLVPAGTLEALLDLVPKLGPYLQKMRLAKAWARAQQEHCTDAFDAVANDPAVDAWRAAAREAVRQRKQGVVDPVAIQATADRNHAAECRRKHGEMQAQAGAELAAYEQRLADLRNLQEGIARWRSDLVAVWHQVAGDGERGAFDDAAPGSTAWEHLVDLTLRFEAFQKALRYWEGRWLIETRRLLAEKIKPNQGRKSVEARFRRCCMLTPCLVITFHMLPRLFQYVRPREAEPGKPKRFDDLPLYGYVDLLVVDEAGQVAPNVGGAGFALASKAVVVGDIHQIEPVPGISKPVDRGNARSCRVLDVAWPEDGGESPFTVATSSVMRLAQHATALSDPAATSPGVMLREHWRCYRPIIDYCDKLVYRGLEAKREPKPGDAPILPYLGWAHVQGEERKANGSWRNIVEAEAIASWVARRAPEWIEHYRRKRSGGAAVKIDDIVAVVTPFKSQALAIKGALRTLDRDGLGLGAITVGTVHSLQGAERDIVVLSPTRVSAGEGRAAGTRLFFDNGPNMLNVAVSRAKDSFVVIGDMGVLSTNRSRPTGLLREYLLASQDNEITDVDGNHRFGPVANLADVQAERIATTQRHRDVLRACLASAARRVVIFAPYLSHKAIVDDGLDQLVSDAIRRRAEVVVVCDFEKICLEARGNRRESAIDAVRTLRKAGAEVWAGARFHNKTVLVDEREIVEGSFNWLSAQRLDDDRFRNHETSWRIVGDTAAPFIEAALKEAIRLAEVSKGLELPCLPSDLRALVYEPT